MFDVRMVDLDTGDYLIDDAVLVERKTLLLEKTTEQLNEEEVEDLVTVRRRATR